MHKTVKIILYALVTVWAIEVISLSVNSNYLKPSDGMDFLVRHQNNLLIRLGRFLAQISSFLTLIQFEIVKMSVQNIVSPIIRFFTNFYGIVYGYVSQMNLYEHPYLVVVGSSILALGLLYLNHKYRITINWVRRIKAHYQVYTASSKSTSFREVESSESDEPDVVKTTLKRKIKTSK